LASLSSGRIPDARLIGNDFTEAIPSWERQQTSVKAGWSNADSDLLE